MFIKIVTTYDVFYLFTFMLIGNISKTTDAPTIAPTVAPTVAPSKSSHYLIYVQQKKILKMTFFMIFDVAYLKSLSRN